MVFLQIEQVKCSYVSTVGYEHLSFHRDEILIQLEMSRDFPVLNFRHEFLDTLDLRFLVLRVYCLHKTCLDAEDFPRGLEWHKFTPLCVYLVDCLFNLVIFNMSSEPYEVLKNISLDINAFHVFEFVVMIEFTITNLIVIGVEFNRLILTQAKCSSYEVIISLYIICFFLYFFIFLAIIWYCSLFFPRIHNKQNF